MIEQINFSIVIIFAGVIMGSVLVLLFATPGALKEYKQKLAADKRHSGGSDANSTESIIDIGLTAYMEELSRCADLNKIKKLKQNISKTISETEFKSTSQVHLHRADSVKKWLKTFSIDQHIKDLKATKVSQQIEFDKKKKDFKLMIIK